MPSGACERLLDVSGEESSIEFIDVNPEVYALGKTPNNDEIVMPADGCYPGVNVKLLDEENNDMVDWAIRLVRSTPYDQQETHVIGGADWRNYNVATYSAAIDDPESSHAFYEGTDPKRSFFRPTLWDDLKQLTPASHGSIAAFLIRNFAYAGPTI